MGGNKVMEQNLVVEAISNESGIELCDKFLNSNSPKYIFGRNIYAEKVLSHVNIDGFIDDFYEENFYLDKRVVRLKDVPQDAIVLVLSAGRPFTAIERVKEYNLEYIDYFTFFKYAEFNLTDIMFNESFATKFYQNKDKFNKIYNLLSDEISKEQFKKLINFKLSYNLDYLKGFTFKEDIQYFEDFLIFEEGREVFVDVGGFDGYTTQEFIKLCPKYKSIHIFEPEEKNLKVAKDRLKDFTNINFHLLGLSNKKETLRFDISGSSSKISDNGAIVIKVDKLDDIINDEITFIKMDIEGAEENAIEGSKDLIEKYHPKLAICVYHHPNDFWKIPEQVLAIRNDYKIYLRHYTESIYETVMFFIPIN